MKPIELKMSAFGPYGEEICVPFDELGDRGVYLIAGDTGAGKTTLFDAITFALFGESSGGRREASMLRSKFADPSTKTFVELSFLYKGDVYHIKRNPEYMRKKDRGEGETKERPEAELQLPDGQLIAGVKNVNDKVTELLGLNKEQFSQIAMIAQGDFLKLLLADTKERGKIFRDIFRTERFKVLQEELQRKNNELKREYEEISRSIGQYLEGLLCPESHVLYQDVEQLKRERQYPSSDEVLKLLTDLSGNLKEQAEKGEKELGRLNKLIGEVTGKLKQYETVKQTLAQQQEKEEGLKRLQKEKGQWETLLQEQEAKKPALERLKSDLAVKKEGLSEYSKLEALRKACEEKEAKLQSLEQETVQLDVSCKEKETALQEGKETVRSLSVCREEAGSLEKRWEALCSIEKDLSAYGDRQKEWDELNREIETEQKNYNKYKNLWEEAKDEADKLERAFLDGQAGVLASRLKDGEPCPVCGSIDHPVPADTLEETPRQSQVEEARQEAEERRQQVYEISKRINKISGRADALQKQLQQEEEALALAWREQIQKIFDPADAKEDLQKVMEKAGEEKNKKEGQCKKLESLSETIPVMEEELKQEKERLQEKREELVREKEALKQQQKQERELADRLPFSGEKEAAEDIKKLSQQVNAMEQVYNEASEGLQKCLRDEAGFKQALETIGEALKEQQKQAGEEDEETLQKEREALEADKKELEEKYREVYRMAETDKDILHKVKKEFQRFHETEQKWQMVKALSDTATGTLSGKEKIALETYVQMAYFDRIIDRANVHLMKMTDGRFELLRAGADNQKSQSGLELHVLDHYYMLKNEGSRSVKSLSGGESFLAALSLALGMSEEVSANAGGIETDALFVDEGFGTLDEAALERAVKTLHELSSTNRIIGIISHVPELKNRMEKQIVIKRERGRGSAVEMIV
ncbi:MAG: SMC family ATPase [Lachnospiraceae bacterium]|nr:SMC family ATPase [Lachnospiraceae bacterium]